MKPLKSHISQVILWRDFNSAWEFNSLDSVNLRKVKHVSQRVFFLSVSVVLCLFLFSPLHAFFLLVLPLFFLLPPFFFILFPRGSPRCLEETWVRLPISWCEKVTKDSMVSVVSCRPLLKRGFKKKRKTLSSGWPRSPKHNQTNTGNSCLSVTKGLVSRKQPGFKSHWGIFGKS